MKNIVVLVNPHSRSGRVLINTILKWLEEHQLNILNKDDLDCPEERVDGFLLKYSSAADLVIVGGGDGSLRAALPGLLKTGLPVLYLPIGTLNNLARTLNLPAQIEDAMNLILVHKVKEVEIATANDIPFHSVIGLGLSTQINRFVRSDLKRWFGAFAFVWTGLKIIYRMNPFRVRIVTDGQEHLGRSWQITVCNGRFYGSGFEIASTATMNDRLLHGQSIETHKWWHAFKFVPLIFGSDGKKLDDLHVFSGQNIEIHTKKRMRVDLDGDVKTNTPLKLALHPQKLKILVPPVEISQSLHTY